VLHKIVERRGTAHRIPIVPGAEPRT
jgi:hypothetical protein